MLKNFCSLSGSEELGQTPKKCLSGCLFWSLCQLGEGCMRPPQESSRKSVGLMMFLVVLMGTIKGSTCLSIN